MTSKVPRREDTSAAWDDAMAKAQQFLENNFADPEVTIDQVADAAEVSRFHFHRIFSAMMGETPAECLRRLRLEAALRLVIEQPNLNLTRVAYDCGFSSQSLFSRMFRQRYHSSPVRVRRLGQYPVNHYQSFSLSQKPNEHIEFPIDLEQFQGKHLACVLTHGYHGFSIGLAYARLFARARKAKLLQSGLPNPAIGISWDNPEITPSHLCRYYAGLEISPDAILPSGLWKIQIPAGTCAVLHYHGTESSMISAFNYFYGSWLPQSNYLLAEFPVFSINHKNPFKHGGNEYVSDICLLLKQRYF